MNLLPRRKRRFRWSNNDFVDFSGLWAYTAP